MNSLHMLALFTLAVTLSSASSQSLPAPPLLFFDESLFTAKDPQLELRMHQPFRSAEPVITQTEPWESWAVFAYNSVLRVGPGEYRMYYDCIEGTGLPPGNLDANQKADPSHRRICLATSADGIHWTKPDLGIFNRSGSTANNIILEDSGNSVFIDSKPGVPASEKWKMICSQAAYASPDGLHWKALNFTKAAEDDTKPTAHFLPSLGKYVVILRRDTPPWDRYIGRCVTDDISDWQKEVPGHGGCPIVFGRDGQDPPNVDVYTNAWTPYPDAANPAVHLFFPSMYAHFDGSKSPWGFSNDGMLDIRLVYSRDILSNITYTTASNARSPFVPVGDNRCGPTAHTPTVHGGWCDTTSGVLASTTFDTGATYMTSGWVPSLDESEVYLYSSGQPFTHGGDGVKQTWGTNTGIRLLRLRLDGFVSVDAPYLFNVAPSKLPSFTTVPLTLPKCATGAAMVLLNLQTSVVGFVAVAVAHSNGTYVEGMALEDADRVQGGALRAAATWGNRTITTLAALAGEKVILRVTMTDSKLFAIRLACDVPQVATTWAI